MVPKGQMVPMHGPQEVMGWAGVRGCKRGTWLGSGNTPWGGGGITRQSVRFSRCKMQVIRAESLGIAGLLKNARLCRARQR